MTSRRRDRATLLSRSPGGPFAPRSWRSPWLTSVLALVLLVGLTVVAVTGLLSYAAYDPQLGGSNDRTLEAGLLRAYAAAPSTDPSRPSGLPGRVARHSTTST